MPLSGTRALRLAAAASALLVVPRAALADEASPRVEELIVRGRQTGRHLDGLVTPRTYVSAGELEGTHVNTVEDFLAYEPSIIVRKRYIGDPNGTVGIRGSNQFQTTHALVYADGLPVHYLLQTQFNGAPRWSLVAPEEVVGTEVLYGPFSAEYSGNAMGGVIHIETALPTERSFHLEGGAFTQDFDQLKTRESYGGRRLQGSYGDRFGNLSVYLSHHHLTNESQPLTFQFDTPVAATGSETPVSGGFGDSDDLGNPVAYYGDTGIEEVTTNLTKLKLGWTQGDTVSRLTVAYEDRKREAGGPNDYLRDASGRPVFEGRVSSGGRAFTVEPGRFEVSTQDRETLLVGGGIDTPLVGDWKMELDFSFFDILTDENRRSDRNPKDPEFDGSGRVTEFDDSGWITGDAKLRTERWLGRDDLSLSAGLHHDHYELEFRDFDSRDFRGGARSRFREASGGETFNQAAFTQAGWQISQRWDVQLGLRYERWESKNGFSGNVSFGDRRESAVSPKLSVGFTPDDRWQFRYSIARATRFPIVEELFMNERRTSGTSLANAELQPEEGLHHNLMIERKLPSGVLRANIYRETIRDVIFNQTTTLANGSTLSTFLPIDEEAVNGIELIANWSGLLGGKVDIRSNLSFTDAEIEKNDANRAIEGNRFPRMPERRGNLLVTYHWTDKLETTAGLRYASDSFGRLDNADRADRAFGGQDSYHFVNLAANYRLSETARVSFGMDNATGEEAYVFHPCPDRSAYVEFSMSF
jgi:iron complex outermembrane recepter protein